MSEISAYNPNVEAVQPVEPIIPVALVDSWVKPKEPEAITADDNVLLDIMLDAYGPLDLYDRLGGETLTPPTMTPEQREFAQSGIFSLANAVLSTWKHPFIKTDIGVENLRTSIGSFSRVGSAGIPQDYLKYQISVDPSVAPRTLNFLHFSTPRPPDSSPEIPLTRIYVTPILEGVGDLAAEVVLRLTAAGIPAHGKILDQTSTADAALKNRLDRMVLFVDKERHLNETLRVLAQMAEEAPEYFEDKTMPVIKDNTTIKGVALAPEPPRGNVITSFRDNREQLLETAFKKVLDTTIGKERPGLEVGGRRRDSGAKTLAGMITNGRVTREAVIMQLQQEFAKLNVD